MKKIFSILFLILIQANFVKADTTTNEIIDLTARRVIEKNFAKEISKCANASEDRLLSCVKKQAVIDEDQDTSSFVKVLYFTGNGWTNDQCFYLKVDTTTGNITEGPRWCTGGD